MSNVFDDNLWNGIEIKKTEKKETQKFNSFWDLSQNNENNEKDENPIVKKEDLKPKEEIKKKEELKPVKQETIIVKQEIKNPIQPKIEKAPLKEEKEIPKVEIKEKDAQKMIELPTRVPVTDLNFDYEENFNYILQERVELEEVEEFLPEINTIYEENKKFIQNLPMNDQNTMISALQEQNQKLLEKISQIEEKSSKIIVKYKNNTDKLSSQIKKLNNALYTSSKIALSTTNSGKHLSIVGKDMTKIPEIYQDKLGGVIESLDLSWNKIR